MRLQIEIDETQIIALARCAVIRGFQRAEPRKAWSAKEYKEAMRWLAEKMLINELEIH